MRDLHEARAWSANTAEFLDGEAASEGCLGSTDGYLKVAYTEADIDTNENMGATSTSYPNAELEGTYIGVGVQKDLDNGFVRLEVGFSNYDDVSVTGSGGDGTANTVTVTGLEGMSARISLGKAF